MSFPWLKTAAMLFCSVVTKEAVWQSEDDYRLSINHFCENGDIGVREILHMFFTRVNMQFLSFARILYSRLEKLGVRVLLYEEVFTDKEMALILRGHITDAYLPSSDLEIVLSCISSKCDIFLSTDEKLIDYCLTLGLNHGTKFAYVSSEDLNKLDEIILQYAHSG